ncbi:endonuclease/exonuclease/phosphatase family protein [Micromonospora olivasterospora]|uniref:Endonuclease/exonuclease/phosphatase family protein n=1 Tax=Micromonospora olivasterospora TaxID=1880 RepID=A0A562IEE0_MICOL|nr:endonuclease/exonuclease/phosphatase family protein [Micromonospora olivasterospora]TWH69105.1 endonuclease/exonuclease/phosphatase family protein [Micromonospora olivasterospora]
MAFALAGCLIAAVGATAAAGWPPIGRSATAESTSPGPAPPAASTSPGPAPPAASTPPTPAPVPLTVLTWNVCANGKLRCLAGHQHPQLAAAIGAAARTASADVLLLQEMCAGLLPALGSSLGAGWQVYFRQASTAAVRNGTLVTRPATCGAGGDRYGQAVAVRTLPAPGAGRAPAVHASWLVELPSPRPVGSRWMERRLAVCVRLGAPRLQVCGAHLSTPQQDPDGRVRAAQAARLAAEARRGRERGYRTIVGGDLNTTPATTVSGSRRPILAPLYDQGVDCDLGRMRPTFGTVKIDYLFSGPGVTPLDCTVSQTALSDHRILTAHYHVYPPTPDPPTSVRTADAGAGIGGGRPVRG